MNSNLTFAAFASSLLFGLGPLPLHAAPFDVADGWIEIAHFDGSTPIAAATYSNGLGSAGDANFAAKAST